MWVRDGGFNGEGRKRRLEKVGKKVGMSQKHFVSSTSSYFLYHLYSLIVRLCFASDCNESKIRANQHIKELSL